MNELPSLTNIIHSLSVPKQIQETDIDELRESIYLIIDDFISNNIEEYRYKDFTHRLFEHFVSSGFHINVILKNLKEDEFEYFVRELEEAIEKRKAKTEKENRDIDDSSQKLSETVEE